VLIVQTKGLVVGGSTKGYAYSDSRLQPQYDSLDTREVRKPAKTQKSVLNRSVENDIFISSKIDYRQRSNDAVERTADRCTLHF
jgi:hypothetical protein